MYAERYKSHHDAEAGLGKALGLGHPQAAIGWETLEKALQQVPGPGRRCIYIHVPYCDKVCTFCNLNRSELKGTNLETYTEYLLSEISRYGQYQYLKEGSFEAVYFGGGTPTILSAAQLGRVLRALKTTFNLSPDCEITLESTLHNLPADKAVQLAEEGVTRFSIGIQTFSDRGRRLLGRTFQGAQAVAQMHELRKVFPGTLGVDIIYSYPDQTLEEVAFDAQTTAAIPADSASFYSLMIHSGSVLAKGIEAGKIRFTQDLEEDLARHNLFFEAMCNSGYQVLELSKLALPGKDEYRYIRIRYENGDILPIGQGAGGAVAGYQVYSRGPGAFFISALDKTHSMYRLMLGKLQFGHYDPRIMADLLGEPVIEPLEEKINLFASRGLLIPTPDGGYELSAAGVFWGNNIAVEMLETAVHAREKKEALYA